MSEICARLQSLKEAIRATADRFGRPRESVNLLAVSKAQPLEKILEAFDCGQRAFGENYAQELAAKAEAVAGHPIEWHFIGPIQSNKTQTIARYADWVHSVDRLKIAQRLGAQRPDDRPPLQVCLQVNVSHEQSKSGVAPDEVLGLARQVAGLPGIRLRGLMTVPAPSADPAEQRAAFAVLAGLLAQLRAEGLELDTLSMGMSGDWEAAVAEGATWIRVGTAIFGERTPAGLASR
jgi:pyridoxal phosphate enzyme (YggS family)